MIERFPSKGHRLAHRRRCVTLPSLAIYDQIATNMGAAA